MQIESGVLADEFTRNRIQATQLEAQKTLADEELLLKSYLYDAIS